MRREKKSRLTKNQPHHNAVKSVKLELEIENTYTKLSVRLCAFPIDCSYNVRESVLFSIINKMRI